MINGSLNH